MRTSTSTPVTSTRASAIVLAALAVLATDTHASLDGHPSVTQYLTNEAPFVVFGVTPTQVDKGAHSLVLTFMATEPLEQVNVFPFVRRSSDGPMRLRPHVVCGPKEPGSWNCPIPVTELLHGLPDSGAEIGLRIEAHGDLRVRTQHSTVIVTVPVRPAPAARSASLSGKNAVRTATDARTRRAQ